MQMPVDQIVLVVTLISMLIACLGIWWGLLHPPQCVLNLASYLTRHFATVRKSETSKVQLDEDTDSDSGKSEDREPQQVHTKLEKVRSLGETSKVDSAAELHKSSSLRCIAVS